MLTIIPLMRLILHTCISKLVCTIMFFTFWCLNEINVICLEFSYSLFIKIGIVKVIIYCFVPIALQNDRQDIAHNSSTI